MSQNFLRIHLFKKFIFALLGGLFLLLIVVFFVHHFAHQRFRIACFPLFSSDRWLDITITDGINDLLQKANSTVCLDYPLDWTFDAIDRDSVSNLTYLKYYGKRIGLDVLVTEQVISKSDKNCVVVLKFYNLKKKEPLTLKLSDTLYFAHPDTFFKEIIHQALNSFSIKYDTLPPVFLPSPKVWKDYGSGRYYQLIDDFTSAEKAYRAGLAVDSTEFFLLRGLASVLLRKSFYLQSKGKYADDTYIKTAEIINKTLEVDSTDELTYCLLGQLYIQRSMWNRAEKVLKKALQLGKDDPFLYFYLTRLHSSRYRKMGFRNKETLLKKALKLNPAFERAWIALGDYYFFRNRIGNAEKTYKKLLEIHPSSLDGLLALGKLYFSRNDILNVIKVYKKVLTIKSDYPEAYYNLGIAYYNRGREEDAIRFFEKAIELNNHVDSYFYLGLIYAKRGDKDKAVEFLRKRIHFRNKLNDPFAEEARKLLFKLLHNTGQ